MKKVSARLFFTILWRGVCQAIEWLFGLFGYKREGKFAKCIWVLSVTSATVILCLIAGYGLCSFGADMYDWYEREFHSCENVGCYENTRVYGHIYHHENIDGKGYIYNIRTGEKLLKHVAWIAQPADKDSLVCFSNGKKRGYFSKYSGQTVIDPTYDHAWIFSDGLASVEEDGYIKFIDGTGKVIIDKKMAYIPDMEGYVFHGGYCVVDTDDGKLCGMMDKKGNIVVPMEYSSIYPTNDFKLWRLQKGEEMAVLNSELEPVLPLTECSLYIEEGTIDVTLPNHTMRKYNNDGSLIHDFYVNDVKTLEYETEEVRYETKTHDEDGATYAVPFVDSYHPKATARMRVYVAGDGYEGLMTTDGHVITMPLYTNIEAIGYDLYLCTSTNNVKVIVNGKGKII